MGDLLLHRVLHVDGDFLLAQRLRRLREEEIDARQHTFQFIARLRDGFADFGGEHPGELLGLGDHALAEAGEGVEALLQGERRPTGLRRARLHVPGFDALRVVASEGGRDLAGRGIDDLELHAAFTAITGVALPVRLRSSQAARKARSRGRLSMSDASFGSMNSGCH